MSKPASGFEATTAGPPRGPSTGSPRLDAVAALVPAAARLADVGSDHGRLPAWLLRQHVVERCIATERTREGAAPLLRLAERVADSRLEIRWGDGLAPLCREDDLDTVSLSGMGGMLMLRLIEPAAELGIRRLVLQPQRDLARVRTTLRQRGWGLVDERFAVDRGHAYEALRAEIGAPWPRPSTALDEVDLDAVGPILLTRAPDGLADVWAARGAQLARALAQAERHGADARRLRAELARAERICTALGKRR